MSPLKTGGQVLEERHSVPQEIDSCGRGLVESWGNVERYEGIIF